MALSAGSAFVTVKPLFSKGAWASAGKIAATGFGIAAVAGIGAIKLAADFEDSMSKIIGLVGINRKQVDAWGKDILDLSKKLPQSPKELADAMFFITSAGLRGKTALDALKVSAHASAAGLGDTVTVADAVTSAMNAYGQKNLTAAHAADILTAAVREGKLAAGSLAPVIGKVLPIAKAMGVGFDEVAGSMALMSKSGTDAAQSATQVTAILGTFAKPSAGMITALGKMHLSLDDVRKSLANKGMVPTLAQLRSEAKKAGIDLSQVFGNKRALTGVLQLTGNLKETKSVMHGVADSAGSADKAFEEASTTANFKFKSALSSLQVIGIKLGNQILPAAAKGADKFSSALDRVSAISKTVSTFMGKMPGPVKKYGAELLIGVFVMSKVTAGLRTMGAMFTLTSAQIAAGTTRTQLAMMRLKAGVGLLAGAGGMLLLADSTHQANQSLGFMEKAAGGALLGFSVAGPWGAAIGGTAGALVGLATASNKTGNEIITAAQKTKHWTDALHGLTDASSAEARNEALASLSKDLKGLPGTTQAVAALGIKQRDLVNYITNEGGARARVQAIIDKGMKAPFGSVQQRNAALTQLLVDGLKSEGQQLAGVIAKNKQHNAEVATLKSNIAKLPKKVQTQIDLLKGKATLRDVAALAVQYKLTPNKVQTLIEALHLNGTVADVARLTGKVKAYGALKEKARLDADTGGAISKVNALIAAIARIHDKTVHITTSTNANVAEAVTLGRPKKRARGGPVAAGQPYIVGDRGPRSAWELFVPDENGQILPHVRTPAFRDPAPGELARRANSSSAMSSVDLEQASYRGMRRALSVNQAIITTKSSLEALDLQVGVV